ncbi:hypothetical protein [Parasitella parasitica]|uniref:Uncharacterized protein n=1 Tax=Parasitella parasitica TaxID=35722 RepID=A0A0B7MX00_9FUNG|nr:hypothetical protein [Parasitella parasitica]
MKTINRRHPVERRKKENKGHFNLASNERLDNHIVNQRDCVGYGRPVRPTTAQKKEVISNVSFVQCQIAELTGKDNTITPSRATIRITVASKISPNDFFIAFSSPEMSMLRLPFGSFPIVTDVTYKAVPQGYYVCSSLIRVPLPEAIDTTRQKRWEFDESQDRFNGPIIIRKRLLDDRDDVLEKLEQKLRPSDEMRNDVYNLFAAAEHTPHVDMVLKKVVAIYNGLFKSKWERENEIARMQRTKKFTGNKRCIYHLRLSNHSTSECLLGGDKKQRRLAANKKKKGPRKTIVPVPRDENNDDNMDTDNDDSASEDQTLTFAAMHIEDITKTTSREATPPFLSGFGADDGFSYISSYIDPVPADNKESPHFYEVKSSPELDPQATCAIEITDYYDCISAKKKKSSREATPPFLSGFGADDGFCYISSPYIDPVPTDSKELPHFYEVKSSPELDPQASSAIEVFKLPKKKTVPEDAIETEPAFQNEYFLTLDHLFHKDLDISKQPKFYNYIARNYHNSCFINANFELLWKAVLPNIELSNFKV